MPRTPSSTASLAARITALRKRHSDLESRIGRELSRPAPDSATLGRLKRHKLMIKDEMSRYEGLLRALGHRITGHHSRHHAHGETA